jgi:hypothetical protein
MSSPIKRLLPAREVCERYGLKASRSLRRWVVAGIFPPPDRVVRGRNYWWLSTLDQHERQLVVEKAAAETSPIP